MLENTRGKRKRTKDGEAASGRNKREKGWERRGLGRENKRSLQPERQKSGR